MAVMVCGTVVEIDDHVPDALAMEPVEHALDQRAAGERHRGFGDEARQRVETRAETGSENERGEHDAILEWFLHVGSVGTVGFSGRTKKTYST